MCNNMWQNDQLQSRYCENMSYLKRFQYICTSHAMHICINDNDRRSCYLTCAYESCTTDFLMKSGSRAKRKLNDHSSTLSWVGLKMRLWYGWESLIKREYLEKARSPAVVSNELITFATSMKPQSSGARNWKTVMASNSRCPTGAIEQWDAANN